MVCFWRFCKNASKSKIVNSQMISAQFPDHLACSWASATHFLYSFFPHNIKLWVYLTPIPERRRRLCRIWPFATPPCHHDRGSSCYCYFFNPSHKIIFSIIEKCFSKSDFKICLDNFFRSIVLAIQINFLKLKMTDSTQNRNSLHFSTDFPSIS